MIATKESLRTDEDLELERRIENFLHSKQVRSLRRVDVEAQQGRVHLRGEVGSFYEKQLCISCARRVAGVIELIDEVLVREVAAASR